MTVLLQGRAASRGINHDGIELVFREYRYVFRRVLPRPVHSSAVGKERAAANLVAWAKYVKARQVEQLHARGIRIPKHHAHDTATHKSNPSFSGLRDCGRKLRCDI